MKDETLKYGTFAESITTAGGQIDCEVIKKLAGEIEKKSVLQKICFSKEQSELKEKYYKAFNELPKTENSAMFGGVQVVEEDILPANTMVWRFTNPVDNRIFIYREGRLYELPRINPLDCRVIKKNADGLLPCPFCGGEPFINKKEASLEILCPNCLINGFVGFEKSHIIEKWNKRV